MGTKVVDNPEKSRYEILAGEDALELAGFTEYFLHDEEIAFIHTEIDPRFEGQGLGGTLARAALDAVRERGLAVLPYCPFIRGWMRKHPEYADLVPESRRAAFEL
ncbi:GNAT family N-acetyltransferase [Embleya sp. NPDC050154]|uniref:GNAT family N-acetyltransferase n=1 Tax=Embleya sp. NPDC050154 TaxID=3363988 RepID=UPI0037B6278C